MLRGVPTGCLALRLLRRVQARVAYAAADWFRKGTSGPKPRERVVVHFGGAC